MFNMTANPALSKSKMPMLPPRSVLVPPPLTACDLVPNRDGSYRAVPRQSSSPARKGSVGEAARLANCSTATIYRLYTSGLVAGERATPRKIMIDLESLHSYLEAARDPDFWTAERRLKFASVRRTV